MFLRSCFNFHFIFSDLSKKKILKQSTCWISFYHIKINSKNISLGNFIHMQRYSRFFNPKSPQSPFPPCNITPPRYSIHQNRENTQSAQFFSSYLHVFFICVWLSASYNLLVGKLTTGSTRLYSCLISYFNYMGIQRFLHI